MRKFSTVVATVALCAGSVLAVSSTAASALPYPGNCSTNYGNTGTPQGYGTAKCTSGGGSYRVVLKCSFAGQTPGTHYGPWVGIGQESKKYCPTIFQLAVGASVQRTN